MAYNHVQGKKFSELRAIDKEATFKLNAVNQEFALRRAKVIEKYGI